MELIESVDISKVGVSHDSKNKLLFSIQHSHGIQCRYRLLKVE